MTKEEEVKAWLEDVPVIAELTPDQERQVLTLLGYEPFRVFLGLLLGARQAYLLQLSNMPLSSQERAAAASVTQGIIKGLDLVRETALELVRPQNASAAPSNEAKE